MRVLELFEEETKLGVPAITRTSPSKWPVKEHLLTIESDPTWSRAYSKGSLSPRILPDIVLKNKKVDDEH